MVSIPSSFAKSAVLLDVGTPFTLRPSLSIRSAKQRTIHAAVEPVPSPNFIPSSTNSQALFAATNLAWSFGDKLALTAGYS